MTFPFLLFSACGQLKLVTTEVTKSRKENKPIFWAEEQKGRLLLCQVEGKPGSLESEGVIERGGTGEKALQIL